VLATDAPTGAEVVASDGEFVGRRAGIAKGVVEDEVFEMEKFAIEPQRGAGIAKASSARASGESVTGANLAALRDRL
jgi:hypothetical protein